MDIDRIITYFESNINDDDEQEQFGQLSNNPVQGK